MTETEVKLVIGAIDGLREDISKRMDSSDNSANVRFTNLQSSILDNRHEITMGLLGKCDTCQNAPTFKITLENHWWHILALWTAIAGFAAVTATCGWYIFNQLNEHRFMSERPAIVQPKEVK